MCPLGSAACFRAYDRPVDPLAPDPFAAEVPVLGVQMMLADAAEVADGKLFVLGGGLTVIGPRPQPLAVVLRIEVPWDRANLSHRWRLDLVDEDGAAVTVGDRALGVRGRFEAGRPPGLRPGTPLSVPVAVNFPTLPVAPGRSYTWQLVIDDVGHHAWRQSFYVRPG